MLQLLNKSGGNDAGKEMSSGMLMSSKTPFKSPRSGRLEIVGRLSPLSVVDEARWLADIVAVATECRPAILLWRAWAISIFCSDEVRWYTASDDNDKVKLPSWKMTSSKKVGQESGQTEKNKVSQFYLIFSLKNVCHASMMSVKKKDIWSNRLRDILIFVFFPFFGLTI